MENIHTKYLKELYRGEGRKAWLSYNAVKNEKKLWEKGYEHDAILAFWLAIDKGEIEFLRSLVDWDISFRYVACLAFYCKNEKSKDTFQKIKKKKQRKQLERGFGNHNTWMHE